MKFLYNIVLVSFLLVCFSCNENEIQDKQRTEPEKDVAYLPEKDAEIQRINLEHQKKLAGKRFECDTLSLIEYVLNTYPEGSYLVNTDKPEESDIPKPAVIYYDNYVFGIVAKSGADKRLIEVNNIVGYEQSFIDLDSTELGTAFFYLTLFQCRNNSFNIVWENPIPSHGGFNNFFVKKWKYNNTPFIKVNFHYAQGTGHIDYNYFLIDGLTKPPHLLMTYEGINFKRTIANLNDDKFPDYYEHVYYDSGNRVKEIDSVAFLWNTKEGVYINTRNSKQTRQY